MNPKIIPVNQKNASVADWVMRTIPIATIMRNARIPYGIWLFFFFRGARDELRRILGVVPPDDVDTGLPAELFSTSLTSLSSP
jgi:hypothetical protein